MDIPEAHYFAVTNFLCCAATRFGILPSNTAYAHLIKYVDEFIADIEESDSQSEDERPR